MKLRTNLLDLWVFHRQQGVPEYLLLHTSQEKADRWFHGGRFWQIPGVFVQEDEDVAQALVRCLREIGLQATAIWAAEHTYIYYNPRRKNIEIIPVFAAEVPEPQPIPLTWEHAEYGWFTAKECEQRIHFRGLKEGLYWTRTYVSEADGPALELRIV